MSINQKLKQVGLNERSGLIVYLFNASDQYKLRKYGDIVYFSKKMKYCVIYVDQKEAKKVYEEIGHLSFVDHVEYSQNDAINLTSEHIEGQLKTMAQEAEEKLQKNNEDLFN